MAVAWHRDDDLDRWDRIAGWDKAIGLALLGAVIGCFFVTVISRRLGARFAALGVCALGLLMASLVIVVAFGPIPGNHERWILKARAEQERDSANQDELARACVQLLEAEIRAGRTAPHEVAEREWPAGLTELRPSKILIDQESARVELTSGPGSFGYELNKDHSGTAWLWKWYEDAGELLLARRPRQLPSEPVK
jgi:hypothetical protein